MAINVIETSLVMSFIRKYTNVSKMKDNIGDLTSLSIDVWDNDTMDIKDEEIKKLKEKIGELEEKIGELEKKIGELETSRSSGVESVNSGLSGGGGNVDDVVDRNLDRVPIRTIELRNGDVVSNRDIILYNGKLPLRMQGVLTEDERVVRRNIKCYKDPNKSEKRRDICRKYYMKRKSKITIIDN